MLKNVAGQAIGAQINLPQGAAFTGAVTVYITGDAGVQTVGAVNGGLCTHEGNGYHSYVPTAAETNYNLIAFTFVGSGSIPATVQVVTLTEALAAAISTATITTAIGDGPTRTELLNQLAHRLNKTPPPNMDSSTEARLVSYLNQRQRRLLTMAGLTKLRDATIAFTTVAGQAQYGVPNISKLSRLFEQANDRTLLEISQQDYRLMNPNPSTGTPEAYIWTGRQPVQQQPVAPTALFIVSSSGSDTMVAHLEGVTSGGYHRKTAVTVTGTAPVNVAPLVATWERVDKFFLATPATGDVVLQDSLAYPLALIPTGQVTSVYTGVTLFPTPSTTITYFADVSRIVSDLVHGSDQAAIPQDFADVLVLGALADEYQHLSDPRWSAAVAETTKRENDLKYWLAETAMGRPLSLTRTWQRPSQLGGWFPAGT